MAKRCRGIQLHRDAHLRRRPEEGPRCGTGRTHGGVEQWLRGGFHSQAQAPETPGLRTSGFRVAKSEDVGSLKNGRPTVRWEAQSLFHQERDRTQTSRRGFNIAPGEVGAQQIVAPFTWRVVGLLFGARGILFTLLGASANVSAGAVGAALGVLGYFLGMRRLGRRRSCSVWSRSSWRPPAPASSPA